tara:strand:+ start:458 stop:985 length:528 start_codon:yes stop_codon:yes gene_type:complete
MCDPATAAAVSTGLKVGGVIMEQRKKEENAQRIAQESKDAYFMKSKQANLRVLQEQNKASETKQDADLKAMKSQGTALAVAGGSGVQGNNVSQLINDFERSEGVLTARVDRQLEGIQQQNEMDKLAFQSEAQSRINANPPPSFAESLFKVAGVAVGGALDYQEATAQSSYETGGA